jgi:signal transduction histidine kinase
VQLGRDLHDNICQTLYAVSLTLEGVRAKNAGTGETAERLDQCIAELRRLNHEVRSYLQELEPGAVQHEPFAEALEAMLATQVGAGGIRLIRNLDPEATALIGTERATEVVNILREAISNSLRHGHARTITVRAQHGDGTVVLAVQDDGAGFDPAAGRDQGHGLANMQARAAAVGGSVNVISAPGKGTRVLLTLPVAST